MVVRLEDILATKGKPTKSTLWEEAETEISFLCSSVRIFFRNIYFGIRNIVHYFPIIQHCLKLVWKDRHWDYEYFFLQFLQFQLKSTRDGILKDNITMDTPEVVAEIDHMLKLIDRYEHYDDIFEVENQELLRQAGLPELTEKQQDERLKQYFIKMNMFEQKCYNEMFEYLQNNMRKWWD